MIGSTTERADVEGAPELASTTAIRPNVLRVLLKPYRRWLALLVATSLVSGLLEALILLLISASAFAIASDEDSIDLPGDISIGISSVAVIGTIIVLARAALAIAAAWQSARLSTSVVASVRTRLTRSFFRARWAEQHGERVGQLQELLTTFSWQATTLVDGVSRSIIAGCNVVALLAIAAFVDPLSSLAVVGALLTLGLVLRPLRQAVRRQAKRTTESSVNYASSLAETSQLGMELHVFGVQPAVESRVEKLINRHLANTRRVDFLSSLVPAVYAGLAYLAMIAAIGLAAGAESADVGSIGAVMLIMVRSLGFGQAVQSSLTSIRSSMPFIDHLEDQFQRFEAARIIDHGKPIGRLGDIELDGVSFDYEPGTHVLRKISAAISANEAVGIVGPSGSGKSTLVQILLGLRDPTEGVVRANGRDIKLLSRAEWARKVTFVPQQSHLIAGSIADNVRFFREGVSQDDIERACRLANIHDDVAAWNEAYDRQVGEQGSHLSGGQQQRIIIARALVEQPELLILDEPTSALDVRSEYLIRSALNGLRDRMTVIIIAHRLSTLDMCDRIMVIQDGELKGFDTPQNLEISSDFYKEAVTLSGLR